MDRIGRYKIVRELGRGAMGVVYHAIDPNIGRPVAIKTIQLGGGRKPEEQDRLRERLFREARSAGILSHPGIVTIYDVEQQGELAYIAMEYVDGPTLDQLLSSPQVLDPVRMFSILAQTAAALDYAHQKGIVHRDIKPANIMIAGDGTAKIADFGIAKITASEQLTMTGSIVGTPHYMSPEQVQGLAVDGRSDQFSLGVIAFEMLTGEKPYTGEHLTTVVYKIVAEEPAPPHKINSSLSGPIEGALRKGLAKKPDARYRNCQEFIEALEKACAATKNWKALPRGGSLNAATVAGPVPVVNLPPARRVQRAGETATAERSQKKKSGFLPFLLAVLMAAVLLGLIGWQASPWWNDQNTNPQAGPHTGGPSGPIAVPQPVAGKQDVASAQPLPAATTPPGPGDAKPSPIGSAAPPNTAKPPADQPEQKLPAEIPVTKPALPEDTGRIVKKEVPEPLPVRRTATARVAGPAQPVTVISSPGGATATLDGRPDLACTTPCSLDAAPGHHALSVVLPGFQIEHRDVAVGSGPVELPAVILSAQGGTLMLSTNPVGASISVNGRHLVEITPAQLSLPPGTYKIVVEKDGRQSTNTVSIRNGEMSTLKVTLGQ